VKHLVLLVFFGFALAAPAMAEEGCLLILDAGSKAVVHEAGDDCDESNTPASTFKVPLAVMGFETGLLKDGDNPALPWKAEYGVNKPEDKATTTPKTWLRDSVLWYSRVLTREMGMKTLARYVAEFDYGNADVSGGLTKAWLNSSLRITPRQQAAFVARLLEDRLPVSTAALTMTREVMPQYEGGSWTVHGKTGTSFIGKGPLRLGWFVGWADKGDRRVIFAKLVKDRKKTSAMAGPRAKDEFLNEISGMLNGF